MVDFNLEVKNMMFKMLAKRVTSVLFVVVLNTFSVYSAALTPAEAEDLRMVRDGRYTVQGPIAAGALGNSNNQNAHRALGGEIKKGNPRAIAGAPNRILENLAASGVGVAQDEVMYRGGLGRHDDDD
jgi:hypothetical protein